MVNTITIFGIHLKVNPIAFTIPIGDGWHVYWYGIIIAFGFLLAMIYALKNANRFQINEDHIINSVIVVLPVAILCARAYYLLFDGQKLTSIREFFGLDSGNGFAGLAIYGGVIGAFLSIIVMCKIYKMPFLSVLDITSIGFLIGQSVGRWGNFVNQEAYGSFTGSSWFGMTSNRIASEMRSSALVHPTFLYESIWCAIGFVLLHKRSKKRKFNGEIALMYGAWYGFGRAFIELLRTDSLRIGGPSGVRVSFLLSLLLCVGCVITLIVNYNRLKENTEVYAPLFSGETPVDTDGETIELLDSEQTEMAEIQPDGVMETETAEDTVEEITNSEEDMEPHEHVN